MKFKLARKGAFCTLGIAAVFAGGYAGAYAAIGLDIERFRTISSGFAAENRCGHLTEKLREELGTHAAFGETAAVRANGADAVREARKAGDVAMPCGEATKAMVNAAMAEGRRFENEFAAHEARQKASQGRLSKRQQRIVTRQRRQQIKRSGFFTVQRQSGSALPRENGSEIQRFQVQLHAYYVERRCQYLRPANAKKFWKMINARHAALSGALDEASLAQSNANAKAAAKRTACSPRARRFIAGSMRALAADL
ncbi:MAG: hypothetical protein ACR2OR_07835 [Hyphomicrobiales bacterium]